MKTFTLRLPQWKPFRPGQHFAVRLTAPDGYQAQRNYSIASPPEAEEIIDLTIELVPGGEVSSYFHEAVEVGDKVEVRGPIGGPFTWTSEMGGPLLLVAGGSGMVPLMSMLRHRYRTGSQVETAILYSSRTLDDIIYGIELDELSTDDRELCLFHTLTRESPGGWEGFEGRVDGAMLTEVLGSLQQTPRTYICGPTGFVEAVASLLVELDVPPDTIRTERFGPSG